MALDIVCAKCGEVLYAGFELRQPADLLKPYGGRCRKCGAKLVTNSFEVEIAKFDGSPLPGKGDHAAPTYVSSRPMVAAQGRS